MAAKLKWTTEQRKVKDLTFYEFNPRNLSKNQAKQLQASIDKFDLVEIPAIDRDGKNTIVAGHQRVGILLALGRGEEEIDVRVPNRKLTESEFKEYNVRSNKNTGDWDWDMLANHFDNDDLLNIGFTDKELGISNDTSDDGFDPSTKMIIDVKAGDVIEIGRHKLICGDCTDKDNVSKLLGAKTVDQLLTDPPYGVDYSKKNEFLNKFDKGNRDQTPIQNDDIKDYREFFGMFLKPIPFAIKNTMYCFISSQEYASLDLAMSDAGITRGIDLVWVKNNHVLGRRDYNAKHENIFYGWKGGHKFYGSSSNTTVLEYDRPLKSDLHPTMKPIPLLSQLIHDGSTEDALVYDPFLGSGSTMVACHEASRICYGFEIDPQYCQTIILRMRKQYPTISILINGKKYKPAQ